MKKIYSKILLLALTSFLFSCSTTSTSEKLKVTKIEIINEPSIKNYYVGDKFQTNRLSLKATWNNGTCTWPGINIIGGCTTSIQESYTFTESDVGEKTVDVRFNSLSASFKIIINKCEEISAEAFKEKYDSYYDSYVKETNKYVSADFIGQIDTKENENLSNILYRENKAYFPFLEEYDYYIGGASYEELGEILALLITNKMAISYFKSSSSEEIGYKLLCKETGEVFQIIHLNHLTYLTSFSDNFKDHVYCSGHLAYQ